MLHKETVTTNALELLRELMDDELLKDFFLVGGTALSLLIGHRVSIDIDLFSVSGFDENKLLEYLETTKSFRLNYQDRNTIKGQIRDVQVDLITHSYPLIKIPENIEGIRLACIEDIAAMKLNAVAVNGTRVKDFIDLACLSAHLSFNQMLTAYETKYQSRNPLMIIKSLTYFYFDRLRFKKKLYF